MSKHHLNLIPEQSCFSFCKEKKIACQKKSCKNWISSSEHANCAIIAASNGIMTLQEVGEIFGLTRMRICQIEKRALEKIKKALQDYLSS